MYTHCSWAVLAALVALLPVGCGRANPVEAGQAAADEDGDARADARRAAALADATCKKILEGRDENARAAEARDWLDPKHSRNAMWKGLNKKEARELVDRFYGLGAAQVYAVYVPGDDQIRVNMCAEFMVELPADAAARAKVLAAYNEFCSSIDPDFRAATDLGQTYLVIDLDL